MVRVIVDGVAPANQLDHTRRRDVGFFNLFRKYVDNDARQLGDKLYAGIGTDGNAFSVNMKNGNVAKSDQNGRVEVVGTFKVVQTSAEGRGADTTKDRLQTDDLFIVKGGKKVYAYLDRLNDGRYISLNIATGDYVANATHTAVTKVGKYRLEGTVKRKLA